MTGLQSVPRAPRWLPILGHAWPLSRSPYEFLTSLRTTGDLVRVDIGTMPVFFVTNAKLAHEVMVTKARSFHKGHFFDRLRALAGNGIANSDGETHRRHRRLMQPMFHKERIAAYGEVMSNRARELADSWKPGETVQVDQIMGELVVNTLVDTMFSTEISAHAVEAVSRNVPIIIQNLLLRTVSPKFLDGLPIPASRRFDAAAQELQLVIDEVVAATRKSDTSGQLDLLSTLLAARDADTGEALTDKEVREELGTILFAGTETTSTTLSWALHEIGCRPEVEERVLAEIDAVVGQRPVTFEDVARLEYLGRIIDEVTRLHGVTLLMRRTIEPVELAGVTLPAGTEVAFSLYALHRDPRFFDDPERFDPDRWLPERTRDRPREAYMPFGAGARKCIGDGFAQAEITIALATILARWRLRPIPGQAPRMATAAVPHPDRLPMTVARRQVPARTTG